MAGLLMENGENKINESLWLKSGDLRRGNGVLMVDIEEGGPSFISCSGQLLNQRDWELVFPTIREDLKKFGGAMAPQCIT